ncbi:hypothetical protein QUA40_09235 [Microcoleus sp. Pol11C3]|uniref:hypothetical protein n=1 Tax=Microcoleus sp. Pol11C3 TaxID=3055390 RepID=UPI002FCFFE58
MMRALQRFLGVFTHYYPLNLRMCQLGCGMWVRSYEEVSRSLEQAEQRAALLAERLRAMGIDPEQL